MHSTVRMIDRIKCYHHVELQGPFLQKYCTNMNIVLQYLQYQCHIWLTHFEWQQ